MDWKKFIPAGLMLGAALLLISPKIDLPDNWGFRVPGIETVQTEGKLLVLVSEKQSASVDETLAVRSQDEVVAKLKLGQFLYVDDDDDWAAGLVSEAAESKVEPPFLALGTKSGDTAKFSRIRKFQSSLEDILK